MFLLVFSVVINQQETTIILVDQICLKRFFYPTGVGHSYSYVILKGLKGLGFQTIQDFRLLKKDNDEAIFYMSFCGNIY